jgi:uncharacterized protein YjbK
MPNLEVETKLELNESEYRHLKTLGRITRRESQVNVYFDDQWKLANASATFRIRFLEDGSDPVLTMKVPISHDDDRRVMQEHNMVLNKENRPRIRSLHLTTIGVEEDLPEEFRDYLLHLGIKQIQRVGLVQNSRLLLEIENIGNIELDVLDLPDGTVVHEAEIESDDASVRERLAGFVRQHAPQAVPSLMSKFQRFRRAAEAYQQLISGSPTALDAEEEVYDGGYSPEP